MGEVVRVDVLKGRPVPPRYRGPRMVNDLNMHLMRQVREHAAELVASTGERVPLVVEIRALLPEIRELVTRGRGR